MGIGVSGPLGWHPFPAPMAILSQPRPGRSASVQCGFCETFGCEVGAKSSSLATVIRVVEKTGRCEIRPNSYVHRIETGANGRVTGAAYFGEKRTVHLQKAKAVVVCANGAETPRLLLLSANKQFPNGLANSSGLVGKYLMMNFGPSAMGVFEHPLNDYKGFAVSRALQDFYELDPQKIGFYGGGGLDARFDLTPISLALNGYGPGGDHDHRRAGVSSRRSHYCARATRRNLAIARQVLLAGHQAVNQFVFQPPRHFGVQFNQIIW
jgi:choline dehydrogenase-like flavoprotein